MRKYAPLLFVVILSVLTLQSCKKGGCNVIPHTSVMESISLVQYPELRLAHQAVAINRGGVSGLIIMNLGNDQYAVYDRCSTVNPEKQCAVELMDNGLVAKDPCSGATYILTNGSPSIIAECPLKPYRAYKNGELIIVSN